MTQEEISDWFLEFAHVEKDYKEEWDAFRFQLCGKMFAMLATNKEGKPVLTLKLPPQIGAFYRENYPYIVEGYYMNKVHWVSVFYKEAEVAIVKDLVDIAYTNFYEKLPRKVQKQFALL